MGEDVFEPACALDMETVQLGRAPCMGDGCSTGWVNSTICMLPKLSELWCLRCIDGALTVMWHGIHCVWSHWNGCSVMMELGIGIHYDRWLCTEVLQMTSAPLQRHPNLNWVHGLGQEHIRPNLAPEVPDICIDKSRICVCNCLGRSGSVCLASHWQNASAYCDLHVQSVAVDGTGVRNSLWSLA